MEHKKVEGSSNIYSGGFDGKRAEITFKGKDGKPTSTYYLENVLSQKQWDDFEATFAKVDSSTGAHHAKHLRNLKGWKQV